MRLCRSSSPGLWLKTERAQVGRAGRGLQARGWAQEGTEEGQRVLLECLPNVQEALGFSLSTT